MLDPVLVSAAILVVLPVSLVLAALYDEFVDCVGFDRRYRIDTGRISVLGSRAIEWATLPLNYVPSRVHTVRSLFETLPIDPAEFTLVDLGSGKGRTLFVGAEFGFARCLGVEISPGLCRASHDNLEALKRSSGVETPIDIVCGDAATFDLPTEPLIVYLYNPFSATVMAKVARNLATSYAECPRPIIVVALHPRHEDELMLPGCLRRLSLPGAPTDFFAAYTTA